jgi:hypothetical protein
MSRAVAVAGFLLAASLVLALAAPRASAHELSFSVRYQITKGKYLSSASCLPGCADLGGIHAFSETDENFLTRIDYAGLKIPKKGNAAPHGSPISIKADDWDSDTLGNWHLAETYYFDGNPNTQANCQGLLFNADHKPPHIFSGSNNSASHLHLEIQAGKTFKPASVTGANCNTAVGDQWHAFYPAVFEPPSDGYLPDMLTAEISLPLGKLRQLKVGDKWGIGFHQDKAKRLPPKDCSDFTGKTYTCNQSLHWHGAVTLERTG